MSELSEIHSKINRTNELLAHFSGVFETQMKHVATKEFVADKMESHIDNCHNKKSIVPPPSNGVAKLVAKLVGAVVLLSGAIVALAALVG